ncbi:hypothetical protein K1W54_21145 [Micromonospora sp. CPCC 205371]|nr:hypothetical protein [Micromonospora sp. CPCC 205371]
MLFLPVPPRWPAPAATALVIGAVAACVAAIATFLVRHPGAVEGLPPGNAVLLGVVLAGGLWVAVPPPPGLGGARLAPRVGVGAAAFTLGSLASAYPSREGLPAI